MPHNTGEFAWWAFNIVLVILIAWAKFDLSEIKNDGKKNRELQEENALKIAQRDAICEERHKRLDFEIADMKKEIREEV